MTAVWLLFEYTGSCASDSEGSIDAVPLRPNQYRGRYMSCWNSLRLFTPKNARLMNGKM